MTQWNLAELIPLVLESGRIGLSYFDSPEKEYKADDSIVTLADRAIEAYLTRQLNHPDRGSYLLGEETIADQTEDYLAAAFRHTAWVIDPIDGTAPFANNLPNWGVSVGFMDTGVLKEGIVFLAALGELYYTLEGRTWREKLGTEPEAWSSRLGRPEALKGPASPDIPRGSMVSISQQLARFGRYKMPFYVQVTGSSVFNMVRLAAGSYGALITRFKIWDFAACLPMLANLGWTMVFHGNGLPMTLTMDDGAILNRPGHPDALMTDLDRYWTRSSVAADVGAGTGLFTRLVAPRVGRVWALEPNEAMRTQGQAQSREYPTVAWAPGTAEATGLENHSLDVLVCAQAFHWFDRVPTAREWRRVLKPGAPVILVWNERDEESSPLQAEYNVLLNRWCPEYPKVNHKNLTRSDLEAFFAPAVVTLLEHRNDQRFDLEGWRGRLRSASYCPLPDAPGFREMMDGLAVLFDRFRDADGLMTFPYVTKTYVSRLN